jgi:hypothetical protein
MKHKNGPMALLLLGAGTRLAVALIVVAILWLGYFWVTSGQGAL